eukprot:GILI01021843.1.p2 GENE.GILI01021843.1~~GILI01021843.1.p2  ORF type:complete len:175 (-),score=41.78 GILI01021843.1:360-884(-)
MSPVSPASVISPATAPSCAHDCHKVKGFDLVLMDFQMPVMDGPTCTKYIRLFEKICTCEHPEPVANCSSPSGLSVPKLFSSSSNATSPCSPHVPLFGLTPKDWRSASESKLYVPIVGLTASHLDDAQAVAKDIGMNSILTKPVNRKGLAQVVVQYSPTSNSSNLRARRSRASIF